MAENPRDLFPGDLPEGKQQRSYFSANIPEPFQGETRLGRFFQKINLYFKKEEKIDVQLAGRIHELKKNVEDVLGSLVSIKQELEVDVDPDLYIIIDAVVDPLIKEFNRIKNTNHLPEHSAKRYAEWIDKAKNWVELCSKRNEKRAIVQAVIEYNGDEFKRIIDRDLKLIEDYLNHLLDCLPNPDKSLPDDVKEHIEVHVVPHLIALQELKEKTYPEHINELNKWRADVDLQREQHFGDALHAIDLLAQSLSPIVVEEEPETHHGDILNRLVHLEMRVGALAAQIPSLRTAEGDNKKYYEMEFSILENEAHSLNIDLRLSPLQSEKLQSLMHRLTFLRKKMN